MITANGSLEKILKKIMRVGEYKTVTLTAVALTKSTFSSAVPLLNYFLEYK